MKESKGEELIFQEIKRIVDRDNWVVPINNVDPTSQRVAFEYFDRVVVALYMAAYETRRPMFMNKLSNQLIRIHQLGYNSLEHFFGSSENDKFQRDPEWQEVFLIVDKLKKVDQQFQKEYPDYGFTALYMNTEEWKHNSIGWKAPPEETSVGR